MATVATRPITAEEFFRLSDPRDGEARELVHGEVVVMPRPGFRHGRRQGRVFAILDSFGAGAKHGRAATDVGILTGRDPDSVRGPDVAYWSYERIPADQEPAGYPSVAPDLCVEILSPSNRRAELREKIIEYFRVHVRMVWLIDPEDRTLTIYRSVDEAKLLHESATFADDEVLPTFSCRVADLFS